MADAAPHFVLVPFLAQGHHIPMADLAQLLAARGVRVSFVTTPLNFSRLQSTVDHVLAAGLPVRFVPLQFPSAEVGLPPACENLDVLPSKDSTRSLLRGAALLRSPLTDYLREQTRSGHPPTCLISDAFHPWTVEIARDFRVPRVVFHGTCCFSLLSLRSIKDHALFAGTDDGSVARAIPGLADRVEVSKAQVPGFFSGPELDPFREEVAESERQADGVVVNTFEELEPWYVERYREITGKKVWPVGPLSLYNKGDPSRVVRGNKASVDVDRVMTWLDSREAGSVLYASFGSIAKIKEQQLTEIGLGLEGSGCPFVWVVKNNLFEGWLSEFEERNEGRCFVIRGWAPQAVILAHPSVGGFMTHCGWNSTLEGLAAGAPMAMWPRFAEQFLNTKLVVEILRVGVGLEVREASSWAGDGGVLGRVEVEEAVRRVMGGDEEARGRRMRAKEVEMAARRAMETGGSSYASVDSMIDEMNNLYRSLKEGR